MNYEVVVVGAGIGGLTVAALLAARGLDVCLLERESQPGGCVASVEKFGYRFDPGLGLYALWEPGEIHDRIFSELPVAPPEVRRRDPGYCVRLPDQSEIPVTANTEQFEAALRKTFPECADQAIRFYRESARLSNRIRNELQNAPDVATVLQDDSQLSKLTEKSEGLTSQTASQHLAGTSLRFRRFVDVQLQLLTQAGSDHCSYLRSCLALTVPRQGVFSVAGGAAALAERLAESIKASGGRIRLDTPVLRLAYDTAGQAIGVDLLSGERVHASRAIVSNLTVWDTYGKLIGLNRTPLETRKQIGSLRSWGVYLLYLGVEEESASKLSASHLLALTDWQEDQRFDPETAQLMFALAPDWDPSAPSGRRAATIQMFTDVDEWFTFHESEEQHEEKDQALLETWWPRIQAAIPELGDSSELIETSTPRTIYDSTRRKLGMVGAITEPLNGETIGSSTSLPNVFMVGDTVARGASIACVSQLAFALANRLTQ